MTAASHSHAAESGWRWLLRSVRHLHATTSRPRGSASTPHPPCRGPQRGSWPGTRTAPQTSETRPVGAVSGDGREQPCGNGCRQSHRHPDAAGDGSLIRDGSVTVAGLGDDKDPPHAVRAASAFDHSHDFAEDAFVVRCVVIDLLRAKRLHLVSSYAAKGSLGRSAWVSACCSRGPVRYREVPSRRDWVTTC